MWERKQIHEDAGKMYRTKIPVKKFWKMGEGAIWEVMTFVRRMDRQGEVLIWCTKCSGYARQRTGPKLFNCCRPEQMGTKEFGRMLKRNQTLEEGRIPSKETKNWRNEGKEYQRHLNKFKIEGLMARRKACGTWQRIKIMKESGELLG